MRMLHKVGLMGVVLGLCTLGTHSFAGGEKVDLKVGDKAPAFQAKDDQGNDWKSKDHVGKKIVVVYFFPAALTGG